MNLLFAFYGLNSAVVHVNFMFFPVQKPVDRNTIYIILGSIYPQPRWNQLEC